ncbi:MAG: YetF domain-containing protein [Bacteroidota bacterium]
MENVFDFEMQEIVRVSLSAVILYIIVILYIRTFGKRSTSELNNFDWIVTVSVGSIAASTIILKEISVSEGAASVLILLILQYVVTKTMLSVNWVRKVIKSTPQLLLFEGKFIEKNMKKERIQRSEIFAAIRQEGLKSVEQIYAVVLETNSKISVIPQNDSNQVGFCLSGVKGLPTGLKEDLKKYEEENNL